MKTKCVICDMDKIDERSIAIQKFILYKQGMIYCIDCNEDYGPTWLEHEIIPIGKTVSITLNNQ